MRNWLLVIIWALLIFLGSAMPGDDIPKPVSQVSTMLHIIEYGVLGFLVVNAFYQKVKFFSTNLISLLFYSFIASLLYAVTDEIHQLFVFGRNADVLDIVADSAGLVIGLIIFYFFGKRLKGKQEGNI